MAARRAAGDLAEGIGGDLVEHRPVRQDGRRALVEQILRRRRGGQHGDLDLAHGTQGALGAGGVIDLEGPGLAAGAGRRADEVEHGAAYGPRRRARGLQHEFQPLRRPFTLRLGAQTLGEGLGGAVVPDAQGVGDRDELTG